MGKPPHLLFLIVDFGGDAGSNAAILMVHQWCSCVPGESPRFSAQLAGAVGRHVSESHLLYDRDPGQVASHEIAISVTWPSLHMFCSRRWQHALVILRSLAAL